MANFASILSLFAILASKSVSATLPSYQINATNLVDTVMESVREKIIQAGLDRINLPDISLMVFNQSLAIRNQSLVGMGNAYRVGDVVVNVTIFSTKFRSAFAVYNVSSDADVEIRTNFANYSDGHVHSDCDNVTAYQVFRLCHLTQTLSLDEFELTIGECRYNVSGLGEKASNDSSLLTEIFAKVKDPILFIFNTSFRIAINSALQAIRLALIG